MIDDLTDPREDHIKLLCCFKEFDGLVGWKVGVGGCGEVAQTMSRRQVRTGSHLRHLVPLVFENVARGSRAGNRRLILIL